MGGSGFSWKVTEKAVAIFMTDSVHWRCFIVPHYQEHMCTDEGNSVLSVPVCMCHAPLHQVYDGIGNMISTMVKMADK